MGYSMFKWTISWICMCSIGRVWPCWSSLLTVVCWTQTGCSLCRPLPSSPNARLHFTQQKHSGCQFLSRAVTIFYTTRGIKKLNGFRCVGVLIHAVHVKISCPSCATHASLSHLEWACCIVHSEGRRGWSSPTRSTVVHPSRRSCDCLTPSRTQCTQSAPGATPFQEPLPPAQGQKLINEQRPLNIFFMKDVILTLN